MQGRYQITYDPQKEILVTVGASESIDVALRALISDGDEVLVPEPSYVSYSPSVIFAGGTPWAWKPGRTRTSAFLSNVSGKQSPREPRR